MCDDAGAPALTAGLRDAGCISQLTELLTQKVNEPSKVYKSPGLIFGVSIASFGLANSQL
jgi:hypothetical protein